MLITSQLVDTLLESRFLLVEVINLKFIFVFNKRTILTLQ